MASPLTIHPMKPGIVSVLVTTVFPGPPGVWPKVGSPSIFVEWTNACKGEKLQSHRNTSRDREHCGWQRKGVWPSRSPPRWPWQWGGRNPPQWGAVWSSSAVLSWKAHFTTSHLAIFQRLMNSVLSGLIYCAWGVYFDDVIINSLSCELYLKDLNEVLVRTKETGITVKCKKCQFWEKTVNFLGH